jgi:hypothetical protein
VFFASIEDLFVGLADELAAGLDTYLPDAPRLAFGPADGRVERDVAHRHRHHPRDWRALFDGSSASER